MSTVLFKYFLNSIDMEIQQTDKANIIKVDDKGRKAVQSQIIKWTNGALNFLSSANPELWSRMEEYEVTVDTDILTLPFYWKTLKSIVSLGNNYRVTSMTDNSGLFYAKSFNQIGKRNGSFSAGEKLTFIGVFKPIMLTDPLREDYSTDAEYYTALDLVKSEYVDIDSSYIDLLKLKVLLSYSARQNMQTPNWYYDYKQQLKIFESAPPQVESIGGYDNEIPFGRL